MMNQLTSGTVKAEQLVNWMEFGKIGCPLLYLGATILGNWLVCLAVDGAINYPLSKAKADAVLAKFILFFSIYRKPRACYECLLCRRRLLGKKKSGSREVETAVCSSNNDIMLKTLPTASSAELAAKDKAVAGGLHVKVRLRD